MQNHSRAYYRDQRRRHIDRKKRIIKLQNGYWYYEHEGILSKGKIHCSCWMCRRKFYDSAKVQDYRAAVGMIDQLNDAGIAEFVKNSIRNRVKHDR